MLICRQGNGHYLGGTNNQDYCYAEKNLKIIADGCSQGTCSEVGTRLFCQLFSTLKERFDINDFEKNVEKIFSKIIHLYSEASSDEMAEFISNNMFFTILACFELEDKFVVKYIGDGYIITVNTNNNISYIRLNYGKFPPYFAYNILQTKAYEQTLKFKTFEFDKKYFKNVGLATDGIAPIVEKKIADDVTPILLGKDSKYSIEGIIKSNQNSFFDDVTILM